MPATSAMLIHPKKTLHLTHRPFGKGFRILIYEMCETDHWLKKNVDGTNIQKIKGWRTVFGFPFEGSACFIHGTRLRYTTHEQFVSFDTIIPPSSTSLVFPCNERRLIFSHREKNRNFKPNGRCLKIANNRHINCMLNCISNYSLPSQPRYLVFNFLDDSFFRSKNPYSSHLSFPIVVARPPKKRWFGTHISQHFLPLKISEAINLSTRRKDSRSRKEVSAHSMLYSTRLCIPSLKLARKKKMLKNNIGDQN